MRRLPLLLALCLGFFPIPFRHSLALPADAPPGNAAERDAAGGVAHAEVTNQPSGVEQLEQRLQQALARRDHEAARDALTRLLALQPSDAQFLYLRGRANFCLGRLEESLADFDAALARRPEWSARFWERGITCYFLGKFSDGAKQFAEYQTYDGNDVENSVWRFACQARAEGVETARRELLPIEQDRRVPMMEIYRLFRGDGTMEDVLQAAERVPDGLAEEEARRLRDQQRFYAHQYLGLYYEATGRKDIANEHLRRAAEDFSQGHYMYDVARVHWQLRRPDDKPAAPPGGSPNSTNGR